MMPVLIPCRNDLPEFEMQIPLEDGTTYTLKMKWNSREALAPGPDGNLSTGWYFEVWDAQGVNVLMGAQKMVADYPLMKNRSQRNPGGDFIVETTEGNGIDPGINDLVDVNGVGRCRFLYFSKAELGI